VKSALTAISDVLSVSNAFTAWWRLGQLTTAAQAGRIEPVTAHQCSGDQAQPANSQHGLIGDLQTAALGLLRARFGSLLRDRFRHNVEDECGTHNHRPRRRLHGAPFRRQCRCDSDVT
jgi:hypothetical protein